jgi:K+-transporting ATPase ATPase C chain
VQAGIDTYISPNAALIQVSHIAKVRNISDDKIIALVNEHTENPLLGMFGPSCVNVLKLNIALNNLK